MLNKIVIWICVTISAGLIIAATAWNFNATASAPERYANKEINRQEHIDLRNQITCNQENILEKMDEIKNLMLQLHMNDGGE